MKTVWKMILIFVIAAIFLSACNTQEPEENTSEVYENISHETEESETSETTKNIEMEIKDEVSYKDENGKFGFHKGGKPVTEPIFDEIIECQKEFNGKTIYEALITEGKRMEYATDPKKGPYLIECPNTLYYIFDEDGNQINKEPLANYYIMEPYGFGNGTYDWFIDGTYNGDYYRYSVKKDGTYYLHSKQSAGADYIISSSKSGKEYINTVYNWNNMQTKHGLTDLEGNVILDNLYLSINPSFDNNFLYAYVGWAFQSADEVRLEIYDYDGNLINNEYNYLEKIFLEDGYLLYAYCFGEDAYEICYDENGNPHEAGWWFVDESGNKLSERFEYISVEKYRLHDGGMWNIEKVTVTDENGTEKEISYEPYKINY